MQVFTTLYSFACQHAGTNTAFGCDVHDAVAIIMQIAIPLLMQTAVVVTASAIWRSA